MSRAARQTGYGARSWIHKNARAVYHRGVLRRGKRHLNHINAKQSCVRILVRRSTRTSGQLFVLTDKRSSRDIDKDVVLIIRIDDQRVRMRSAASLHRGYLFRIPDVGNIENPHAAETIL